MLLTEYRSRDDITLQCPTCQGQFTQKKNQIQGKLSKNKNHIFYCSKICSYHNRQDRIRIKCVECSTPVYRVKSQISTNTFCSKRCCALYYNKNKIGGSNRSKLELWLESQLIYTYPNLTFSFNDRSIGLELDIYIPELKLAFELNGIFHYEPIFGSNRLNEIQSNDSRKFKFCHENGISLCVLDTSAQKRFTEKSSQKYLDIITKIISERIRAT